jgi:aryl-alcohol dehydrogenase-like predicted oxidoreductase
VSDAGRISIGGLEVDRLGFGAMRITGPGIWGPPDDPAGAVALLRRVVELGVDFIDTADSYGPEVSEELIARALAPYGGVTVATKGGMTRSGPERWRVNSRPEHLRAALEGGLRRLGVERIDLYQLHRPDPVVPIEESLGVLVEAQRAGTIGEIGVSNVTLAQLERALAVANVVSVQNRYSVLDRGGDDVLAECERRGIAFIPWFPLAAGRAGGAAALEPIAEAHDATTGQVALAWLLARSPVMVPIPGTSQVAHLEENVAAAELVLSAPELEALDRAAREARPGR